MTRLDGDGAIGTGAEAPLTAPGSAPVPAPAMAVATVNGEPYDLSSGLTVSGLVAAWCPSPRGVAVAIDSEVVPRSTWDTTLIEPGATIEIVTAAAGG
ncbi:MAG: sulfur carrier protein ThiS [Acidimicrobiales bacterium]